MILNYGLDNVTRFSPNNRHSKPFNPLLGETYELVRPDMGYCIVTEQVLYHSYYRVMIPIVIGESSSSDNSITL